MKKVLALAMLFCGAMVAQAITITWQISNYQTSDAEKWANANGLVMTFNGADRAEVLTLIMKTGSTTFGADLKAKFIGFSSLKPVNWGDCS